MRDRVAGKGMRTLSRFALIGLIGGASAACSTDAVRLDPFSNPFSSSASGEPGATGSLPEGDAVAAPIRSAPIQSRPLSAPLAAAPLSRRQAAAPVATPRVAAAAPVTGGPAGWSASGGTTITVGANDSLNQMSTRFGVPAAAILQANGLSSAAQITPGRQVVIPVYHAGGVPAMSARAVPAAPAPRVQTTETRAPEPVRRVAEVAPRPEPARREPEPEPARKPHTRPGQAEAKPVVPAAAERAAKLTPRKPEPREEEERVAAKPQRPEPKAVAKVAARQQDDDRDEPVAAKPQKAEPKAAAKPEPKKAETARAEHAKAEHSKPEPKVAEKAKPEPKKVAEVVKPEPRKIEIKAEAKPEPKKAEHAKPEPRKPEPKQAEAPKPEVKKVAEVKPEPIKPVKVAALPEKAPEPAPAPAVAPAAPAPDPQSSFRWPARGRVINGYGSAGNEGINIAVPEGTPVKAAEEGTVAYAGSDVKGYGKLVLVRHANGYVSAYAHNGEIDVRPGEKVKRGQTIAKSGASGNVTSPQLHFEIRKGATPVDPMPHLASN
ncbi:MULTISPECIES: peptidoglycan DD-metalloendopeptidase family protein [Methylobacterium]|uniref:peptidoglycan DD-metalloendopeptidase family protein n=1 Tax=Methylobacterium TaxID=407 RepID=UPI0013EA578D|nr:peptidoglycan DD-metalloendopeptidase family protein [Methylobacterium sp. DB0501]NGM35390.1 peptidoglycan DD-metalloendopeptidase family protein [Methylobacterium sp. DB0501]